jgi:hypothetical protein
MANWPSIRTSDWELFREKPKKRQIRTPFEAGYVQTGAAATQLKMEFKLGWKWLLRTDYDTLVTFFDNNQGTTFTWTHIITAASYTCGWMQDELPEAESIGTLYIALDGVQIEER